MSRWMRFHLGGLSLLFLGTSGLVFGAPRADGTPPDDPPPATCTGCAQIPQSGSGEDLNVSGTLTGNDANGQPYTCKFTINLVLSNFSEDCTTRTSNCGSSVCKEEWKLVFVETAGTGTRCQAVKVAMEERLPNGTYQSTGNPHIVSSVLPVGGSEDLNSGTVTTGCGDAGKDLVLRVQASKGSAAKAVWSIPAGDTVGDRTVSHKLKCGLCTIVE